MAVTVDQANVVTGAVTNVPTNTANYTTSATVASGAMIAVLVGRFNSTNTTLTMSGGSLTWTQAHTSTSGSLRTSLFYAFAPAGLASGTTLTVTPSAGGSNDITVAGTSYLGIDTSGTVVAFNAAAASAVAWASGTVAGNSGDCYIGGAYGDGTLSTSTATSGTERVDFNSAVTSGSVTVVDKIGGGASDSVGGNWSPGSLNHLGIGVAFKVAATGAAGSSVYDPQIQWEDHGPGEFGPNPFLADDLPLGTGASSTTFPQALTATVTTTATMIKQVGKIMAATATTSASMIRTVGKTLAATATTSATMVRSAGKTLTATVTVSATLAAIKVILRTLTATVTVTASMTRQVGKVLATTVTVTASMIRQVGKTLTATVTVTTTLAALKVILRTMTATVTVSSSMVRQVGKPLAVTVTAAASMVKQVAKRLTATVTVSAALTALKVILKTLTATVTATASTTRSTGKVLVVTVTTTATVVKRIAKTLTATVTSVASLIADAGTTLVIGFIDGLSRSQGTDAQAVTFALINGGSSTTADEGTSSTSTDEGASGMTGLIG